MRVDSWKYDIGLELGPWVVCDGVDKGDIATVWRSFLTSKKDDFLFIGYCSVIFESDGFAVAHIVQLNPYIVVLAVLLGEVDFVEIT